MKVFRISPWNLFYMQVELGSALENKKQLIRFRVYVESATSVQTDGDG